LNAKELARREAVQHVFAFVEIDWIPKGATPPQAVAPAPEANAISLNRRPLTPRNDRVGAFADPNFPAPVFSVYEDRMHSWVNMPRDIEHMT
jgi:hypothetical protein